MNPKAILDPKALVEPLKAVDKLTAAGYEYEVYRENVLGFGAGVKWTNGQPTGEPALIAFVTHKVPADQLPNPEQHLIPKELVGMQTDVLAVGHLFSGEGFGVSRPMLVTRRLRPAKGGMSVGHYAITAGTLGTVVYDILPGGSVNPPGSGYGIPQRYYILSNNHVLANSNAGRIGDPILQPGPYDGGNDVTDRIGVLSRYVPIQFSDMLPVEYHNNLVDAALAEVSFQDVEREIYSSGPVRGWARRNEVYVGMPIKKTGRTTNLTIGYITAVGAIIDVNYGNGRVARFRDQIVASNMIQGGDSGSLVTDLQNRAVGLAFAGSPYAMIANQIEHVRSQLRVELSDSFI